MNEALPITIPLINPNEPDSRLAALHVQDGQQVRAGQPLCTLETTKATHELAAEADGYVAGLRFAEGQSARAGELLCYLAPDPKWSPPELDPAGPETPPDDVPAGLRITAPARALAEAHGLDLARLPEGPLITAEWVRAELAQIEAGSAPVIPPGLAGESGLIVYGGGGHGKAVIDLLRAVGSFEVAGVVDDGLPAGSQISGLAVLGGREVLAALLEQGVRQAANAVGGIGDIRTRIRVFDSLIQAGFACPTLVHPSAVLEPGASLEDGCQVFPLAYVGSDVRLGFGVIVNTSAVISHDCRLDDYANISPGALLAGGVQVGRGALIGMGVTVNLAVRIGAGARVGNGATVKEDVPPGGLVRAGSIWPEA